MGLTPRVTGPVGTGGRLPPAPPEDIFTKGKQERVLPFLFVQISSGVNCPACGARGGASAP